MLRPPARRVRRLRKQDGAFAIMFALLLVFLIGMCGLALDVGPLYNRKVDLSNVAEAAALAAAKELNGTAAGIAAARASAKTTAERLTYHNGATIAWNDAALSFAAAPARTGTWIPASEAGGSADSLYFAKVDTAALDPALGEVRTMFMAIFWKQLATVQMTDSAVAGKTAVNATPIAICAMSPVASEQRTNAGLTATELVQYGFRRGVSYDLMQLNPNGTTPARFLINPAGLPGSGGSTFDMSLVGQFLCTGVMWTPRLTGGTMSVSSLPATAPLDGLSVQLNSRFDDFTGRVCNPNGAPPDFNVKQYAYDKAGGAPWMSPATGNAAALSATSRGRLETIADLPTAPAGTLPAQYGPLWTYAKAAKYAATEPSAGYGTFATADWSKLYKLGPSASGYPTSASSPYLTTAGSSYAPPDTTRLDLSAEQRRVLHVPLLNCPVASGTNVSATVLALGRFFMTVQATNERLVAEFAGVATAQSMTGLVELYP